MNDLSNHFRSTRIIVYLDHIDIASPMIWERVGVDIWCRWLDKDYLLVNQILNFVLDVDRILSIMPNTVGMISTYLIWPIEFRIEIHGFGPHWVDISGRS